MKTFRIIFLLIACLLSVIISGCSDKASTTIDLNDGLMASLNFDNNLDDQTGNGNAATAVGGSYNLRSTGNWDYKLNGTSEYLKLNSDPTLNSTSGVTVSIWIKPQSFVGTGNEAIVMKPLDTGAAPYYQYMLGLTGSNTHYQFYFQLNIDGVIKTLWAKTQSTPGKWFHVVGLYNGSKIKIYINGLLEYTFSAMGNIPNNNTDIYIGKNSINGAFIPCEVDKLRIYNKGLTGEEVWKLYQDELE
jgi:hypothetical protein